ncbi:MAG TPA: biotin-dependent carboxyltransferase family protein [Chthoniobacterales bacterium]|nr:biotin-dependent carboxyltransferase family protein [Chthoniobacterales bacterium]
MQLLVRRAGFLTTVQDLGRAGFRASGVSTGGALDAHALRIANLLVGNEENAAGLEITLGTVRLEFETERLIAWCGGAFQVRIGSDAIPAGRVARANRGEELQLIAPPEGARAWLAISGGIDVPLVLGSRSTDLRSGFGGLEGRTLRDGDRLPLAPAVIDRRYRGRVADWFAPDEWAQTRTRHGFLRVVRGAEWGDFDRAALLGNSFAVTPESDRMGVRLQGAPLPRNNAIELLSEAVAPGTIQVPPNGQPILLLGDCQTIGGYPKIAHVISVDLPAAAQLRPGDQVRFVEVALGEAQRLLHERERDLERFRVGVKLRSQWS